MFLRDFDAPRRKPGVVLPGRAAQGVGELVDACGGVYEFPELGDFGNWRRDDRPVAI